MPTKRRKKFPGYARGSLTFDSRPETIEQMDPKGHAVSLLRALIADAETGKIKIEYFKVCTLGEEKAME